MSKKKNNITFINEHKRQNIKNFITADIECCIVEVASNDYKYVIAEHKPISIGSICQGNFKYYFGLDCIKRFARDLLEIETENNLKRNEKMIFAKEDELNHETNYDFNLLYSELFKQNIDKRNVDNIPLAAGKSKMFSIGCLKFLDSYNFLAKPLDQMAKIYGCKTKRLYPYEYFGLDDYDEFIGNLKIEDFESSLSKKLPTQEEVDKFNKDNSHKTGKDLTIEYLQNDVELLDYCMNEYVILSIKEFGLNPLHYVSLPCYSFDCWLMSSGVTLDTLQDKQKLCDFVEAKRGGICGIMGDRYINNGKVKGNQGTCFADDKGNGNEKGNRGTCFADGDDKGNANAKANANANIKNNTIW